MESIESIFWGSVLIVCLGVAAVFGLHGLDRSSTKDGEEWAARQTKFGTAGELAAWHVDDSWLTPYTTLTLKDGTQVRVEGRFNVIKPGAPVQYPFADSPKEWRFYCIAGECRRLARF